MDDHDVYQPIEEEPSEDVETPRENAEDEEEQLAQNVAIEEGQPQDIEGEEGQITASAGVEEGQLPGIIDTDPEGQLSEVVGLNTIQVLNKHIGRISNCF